MSKLPQILQLQPQQEIVLQGPFDHYVEAQLKLTNPLLDKDVYYKVKTTAPKFYCVRPNSGVIKPKEQTTVKIVLQPTDLNDLVHEKSRHKFMIQSYIPQTEEKDIPMEQFWKEIDTGKIMDTKLRVTFLAENGETLETVEQFGSAFIQTPKSTSSGSAAPQAKSDQSDIEALQTELQRQRDLCQMYQDEKKNLEKENTMLLKRNDHLSRTSASFGGITDGFPMIYVVLFCVFALILGLVIGKSFF